MGGFSFRLWPALAAAAFMAPGCLPNIPHDDPPLTVEAEFDPGAEPSPKIPSPTDLVYDAETGLIDYEVEEDDPPIKKALGEFLNSLDGWPASMAGKAKFLGAIDPETINADTVRVYDITDLASPERMEDVGRYLQDGEEEGEMELLVYPGRQPSWGVGKRYAIAVLGGEDGVRGAGGEMMVPSSTFWFFRSDKTVAVCEDEEALEGCESLTDLIDDEDVTDFEEVRRESVEVFDALEGVGLAREDLALAWSFRTSTRTVVPFDTTTDDVHFPNDAFLSDDDTHLEVPLPTGSTDEAEAFLARLNLLDGYSQTGSVFIRFVGPFDGSPANLIPTSMLFVNADEDDDYPIVQRLWHEDRGEVEMVMHRALHSHIKYVAVATEYLVDEDGEDIIPSHVWSMIKAGHPAIDGEGRSLVSGLSDSKAADLNDAIEDYKELFKTLYEEAGYPKEMIQAGVAFTTQSFIEEMQYLRECPRDTHLGTDALAPRGRQNPADVIPTGIPTGHLLGVVVGTIPGLDLMDPYTREIGSCTPNEKDLPFVMTIPADAPDGYAAPPIVIFQHTIGGSKEDLFLVADGLAEQGLAAIAIDLLGHGERGVCLTDDDCDGGGECDEGSCSRGSLKTDADGLPLNSADVLFPVSRPFALRDVMRQQAVDLVALARSLRADDGPASVVDVPLDPGEIMLLGTGFGAMAGAVFIAVDPTVEVAVLSGPGGNQALLADESSAFSDYGIDDWLERDLGLEPGSEAHHIFRYGWSWAADPGDAGCYVHYLIDAPLPDPEGGGNMDPRTILVQVAEDDEVIPYLSQRFFYISMGAEVYPETFAGAGHGFILDPSDATGAAGLAQAAAFLATGGDTILPAEGEGGGD